MNTRYTFVNNEFIAEENARLNVSDLAVQRGYGLFDFFKIIDNHPVYLDNHLDRFFYSAREMNLEPPLNRSQIKDAINTLIKKNNIPGSGMKLILTGGYSSDGYSLAEPNFVIIHSPLVLPVANSSNGLKLITCEHQRQIPFVKTIDYVQAIRMQPVLKEKQADDLLFHSQGIVRECPRSNFWIVTGSEILTAKNGILHGVIRSKILTMQIDGYTIAERDFTLDDVSQAKEAFISSTTKNGFPVIEIDGKPIANGQTGEITTLINQKLAALVKEDMNKDWRQGE